MDNLNIVDDIINNNIILNITADPYFDSSAEQILIA